MDQIFTAITTAANALAKMVNATHVFVISDMPCNEVPFDVPATFITTSTLANGVNDELRDFLREGGTRTFNDSIVAPALHDFSLVQDVATAAYIDDIVDGGFVLGVLCLSQLSSIVVVDVKQLATVKTIDKTGERVENSDPVHFSVDSEPEWRESTKSCFGKVAGQKVPIAYSG